MLSDISKRPTRIQDIPKNVLGLYGIVIVNEEGVSEVSEDEDSGDPGRLVIDECSPTRDIKVRKNQDLFIKESDRLLILEKSNISTNKGRIDVQKAIQQFQISTSNELLDVRHVRYCNLCKKLTFEGDDHNKKHCFFDGCPELIETDMERERHKKMHDHPTKPLQCRWCKKRYRYFSYVEKHYPYCKAKRKTATAKENWKKATAKCSSN